MFVNSLKINGFQEWSSLPVSTQSEVVAPRATLKFSAKTTTSEKIQRIFNASMFLIVGATLAGKIAGFSLGRMAITALSRFSFFQIPSVAAIIALAPKIIVTLAVILVVRKVLAVAINYCIYPVALVSLIYKADRDLRRWQSFQYLTNNNYECRRVALNKSGINYDAFVLEHQTLKGNGQWVIMAGGNGQIGESFISYRAQQFTDLGFNILYVNGPGAGRSSGHPSSYSIGAGQEAGLQFLEQVVGAKNILLYGYSFGSGAQAKAIADHTFKTNDIDYMVWSDRSFDTLSNAASGMVTRLTKLLFPLLGIELDGIKAAKKLQKLGIEHIVTQNSHILKNVGQKTPELPLDKRLIDNNDDDVIPNKASLYEGLKAAGFRDSNRLKCYGHHTIRHYGDLPGSIKFWINIHIQNFFIRTIARKSRKV